MISELRYVIRSLLRRKGFLLVTLLTLGLGIGSATAIYSIVDWFLFRKALSPPGVYMIGSLTKEGNFMPTIMVPYRDAYRGMEAIFSDLAVCSYAEGNVVVAREPVQTSYTEVSTNFLDILGIKLLMGRGFVPGEDVDGRDQVVVVNYGFWKRNLGGSPDALGKTVILNQQPCTVVGVLAQDQRMPPYIDGSVFHPLVVHFNPATPWEPNLVGLAKVRPGVTRKQAEDAMAKAKIDIPENLNWLASTKPSLSTIADLQKIFRPEFYWTLVGAVGFLYAIACLNATNLVLVHMLGKQREISVRLALGGGRLQIVRLLVFETLGLSVAGSLLGALVANVLIPFFNMAANSTGSSVDLGTWHLYWRTYIVLGGLSIFTGFIISLIPAIHVFRSDINSGLKNGGGAIGESPRLARLRALFVILQATFAVILLIGAGLMVQSFQRLETVKVGFDPSRLVKLNLAFPKGMPSKNEDRLALLRRLQDRLGKVPDVSSVAYSSESLMAQYEMSTDVMAKDGTAHLRVDMVYVSPEYNDTSGMQLKSGRWISGDAKDEIMVSESLAKVRFGSGEATGQFLRPFGTNGDYKGWHIVGVVGDIRERVRDTNSLAVYMPISWAPASANNFIASLRTEPTAKILAGLRQVVFRFDPRIVINKVSPMAALRQDQLHDEMLALSVLKVLAGIAVLLTIVGMFSVLAYTVDRRMAEFGIRMALGASPGNLVALVMRRGVTLTVIGLVCGIGGALGLTRYLQSLLFESPAFDPLVTGAVAALLLFSAVVACILPANRASKPDLIRLLKSD